MSSQTTPKLERMLDILEEHKASDIEVYHVTEKTIMTDYFVVATGQSRIHTRALADEVRKQLKSDDIRPHHVEGADNPDWKVLDYGDVVLHIFLPEARTYYNLEEIWGQSGRPAVPQDTPVPLKRAEVNLGVRRDVRDELADDPDILRARARARSSKS